MGRNSYESYDYIDHDYLYTYKKSSVLINKFNEKDAIKARELEYQLVASQSLKLFRIISVVPNSLIFWLFLVTWIKNANTIVCDSLYCQTYYSIRN